jgi:hypothetical protein
MKNYIEKRNRLINRLNENKKTLMYQYSKGKLDHNIYSLKLSFFSLIDAFINAANAEVLNSNKKQSDEAAGGNNSSENIYLSNYMRRQGNNNEREAARLYSISKTKEKWPELF